MTSTDNIDKSGDNDKDQLFGWLSWRPRCAQVFNKLPWFVFCEVIFLAAYSIAGSSLGVGIPYIEKQFGLSSKKSGLMASIADFGGTSIILFIGYIGIKYNMAKILAFGSVASGLGALLMYVPHFITASSLPGPATDIDPYLHKDPQLCDLSEHHLMNNVSSHSTAVPENQSAAYVIMIIRELLRGFGVATSSTASVGYIDTNGQYPLTALYIGITYTSAQLSSAVLVIVTGYIVDHVYVSFDTVDKSRIPKGPEDPHWIGAWWIGFLVVGVAKLLIAIPLFGFPKSLPGKSDESNEEMKNGPENVPKGDTFFSLFKNFVIDFSGAFKRLFLNPEFVLMTLGEGSLGVGAQGMGIFALKYYTQMYNISNQSASYIASGRSVQAALAGILGGSIIRKFKLRSRGIEFLSTVLLIVAGILGCGLLAKCSDTMLAGLDVPYSSENSSGLVAQCQGACQCQGRMYSPVCGADNLVYYSACHAGCTNETLNGTDLLYTNCSCIHTNNLLSETEMDKSARVGLCENDLCYGLYVASVCMFLLTLLESLVFNNTGIAILRCVDQDLRPFALGLLLFFSSLVGFIPSPILIGAILDSTCQVWSDPGPGEGNRYCQIHDKSKLSLGFSLVVILTHLVAAMFYFTAGLINVARGRMKDKKTEDVQETENNIDSKE